MKETQDADPLRDAEPPTARPAVKGANAARQRIIRMPDGELVEILRGWNELPDGSRAYLRRDGSIAFDSAPANRSAQVALPGSAEATEATPQVESPYPSWSRPPFQPGHTLSVKHGAQSPRIVEPLTAELVTATLAAAPFLSEPSFQPAVQAWARAEARCALLEAYFAEHGLLDEKGNPRPATKLMTSTENLALKLRTRLGLDAASRAGIEASLTSSAASQANLEAALERGAELIRQRVAASAAEASA